jgi:hypothetical protein
MKDLNEITRISTPVIRDVQIMRILKYHQGRVSSKQLGDMVKQLCNLQKFQKVKGLL